MPSNASGPAPSADKTTPTDFSNCHTRILNNFGKLKNISETDDFSDVETQTLIKGLIKYFKHEVWEHHREEEEELFEAVLDCTHSSPDASKAKAFVKQLTEEHRDMENQWRKQVKPDLRRLSHGKSDKFDRKAASKLASDYLDHARFEEEIFLPFAEKVLKGTGMSSIGLALHLRRAKRGVSAYI